MNSPKILHTLQLWNSIKKKLIFITSFGMCSIALMSCSKKEPIPMKEYYWENASNYTVVEEKEDGLSSVELQAPDYAQIVLYILEEDNTTEITSEILEEAIKKYPNAVKEYQLTVSETDEKNVKMAFNDHVAKDLAIVAISRVPYVDEWEAGE